MMVRPDRISALRMLVCIGAIFGVSLAPGIASAGDTLLPTTPTGPITIPDPVLGGEVSISTDLIGEIEFLQGPQRPHAPRDAAAKKDVVPKMAGGAARPSEVSPPKRPAWMAPLTPGEQRLRSFLRQVTEHYDLWQLNTRDHSPWEILHLIVANGTKSQVRVDGPAGQPVTAIGWLLFNRPFRNMELMVGTPNGFHLRGGPGLQGHEGQLLSMLAQARVMRDYPMRIAGETLTVEDLIEYEKRACRPRTELTFRLIGLNHYLDPQATWASDIGEAWSIERLVREESAQPIRGVACGGTHRLQGIVYAIRKREKHGLPLDGVWAAAAEKVRNYQALTFRLQNRDGSFSTQWFHGRGAEDDMGRRMRTSGHTLEWLVVSLPDDQLRRPDLQLGVAYVAGLLWRGRYETWDAGWLGHSIHALRLYDERVFRPIEALDAGTPLVHRPTERAKR